MLLPQAEKNKLSADNHARLEVFFRNFCEGSLRRQYGLGHLVYACHAAFPLVLTPELANLIWVNFKHYPYQDGSAEKIDAIAVSDFLLSPLCQQISYQQYEVMPQIRSYLLHLLNDGSWFRRYGIALNGTERLHQLADFLQQYVKQKQPNASQEITGFNQLNEWAALAYLNPLKLAGLIGDTLANYSRNNQGQLWVNTQMERFDKQFSLNVHNHNGNKEVLRPFLNLYHYTQARKSEIFKDGADQVTEDAFQIRSIPTGDGKGRVISMPLSKAIADRTNRRLNKVQRIVTLLIGIDKYVELKSSLQGCVFGATQIAEMLAQLNNNHTKTNEEGYAVDTFYTLYNEDATADNIFEAVRNLFHAANPEDICLIYFAGHGENGSYSENTIIPVDHGSGNNTVITNTAFFNAIQAEKDYTPCKVVLIVDSHTGYYNWVAPDDVFIGAVRHTMQTEQAFDGKNVASAFLLALREIIRVTNGKITYRHLLRWLRFKVEEDFGIKDQTPVLQTTLANLDHYFLRTDPGNANDASVIVFHKQSRTWRVLEEDFKVLTLNSTTHLRNYETNELIPDVRGELFVRDNVIYFGGKTEGLDENRLYKADIKRPEFAIVVTGPVLAIKEIEKIADEIDNIKFDWFSIWGSVNAHADIRPGTSKLHYQMSVDIGTHNYQVGLYKEEESWTQDWIFSRQTPLVDFLHKFARFHYLNSLSLPKEYNIHRPIKVWLQGNWEEKMAFDSLDPDVIIFDERALLISEGNVTIKPITIHLKSNEDFPVFCTVCLLVSNLTILHLVSHMLMPHMTFTPGPLELEIFEEILEKGLNGQFKLLTSRDPHQVDFSQTGIEQQIN